MSANEALQRFGSTGQYVSTREADALLFGYAAAKAEPLAIDREALARVLFLWDTSENINEPTWEGLNEVQRNVWLEGADAVIEHLAPSAQEAATEVEWGVKVDPGQGMRVCVDADVAKHWAEKVGSAVYKRTAASEWQEVPADE